MPTQTNNSTQLAQNPHDTRPPYLCERTNSRQPQRTRVLKSARRRVPGENERKRGGRRELPLLTEKTLDVREEAAEEQIRYESCLLLLLVSSVESAGKMSTQEEARGGCRLKDEGRGGERSRGAGAGHESGCGQRGRQEPSQLSRRPEVLRPGFSLLPVAPSPGSA
ncbi:hypothetical protein Mapa_000553 [Marchantia paleacea]|nr:hypothetical protein Mapa_000553 [Marchantia paleacea]